MWRKKPQKPVIEFNLNPYATVFNVSLMNSDIKLVHPGGQDKLRRNNISLHQGIQICYNEPVKSLTDDLVGIFAKIFLFGAGLRSFFAVDQNLIRHHPGAVMVLETLVFKIITAELGPVRKI
jgi:hypothetical protein